MKALVLAGGTGTRLRPLTNTTTKQLLPVANRPILFYIMDMVQQADITDIGITVSPEWGEQVKQAIGDGSRWGGHVTYILQSEPAGLAHAVKVSQPFLDDYPFLMILGDNLYNFPIGDFVGQFQEDSDGLLLLKAVEAPEQFGIAELDSKGRVVHVEEKPGQARSNLALAGAYLFSSAIHEAIDATMPSPRGELEITDAIQQLIDAGGNVSGYIFNGWWLDTGSIDDLLQANSRVLNELLKENIQGQVDSKSKATGKVEIRSGSVMENSQIRGPVSIAEDCFIKNSLIGPFTSVGAGTRLEESSVERSIIMEDCHLSKVGHLVDSVLGKRVKLLGQGQQPKSVRLCLGDDAKKEL